MINVNTESISESVGETNSSLAVVGNSTQKIKTIGATLDSRLEESKGSVATLSSSVNEVKNSLANLSQGMNAVKYILDGTETETLNEISTDADAILNFFQYYNISNKNVSAENLIKIIADSYNEIFNNKTYSLDRNAFIRQVSKLYAKQQTINNNGTFAYGLKTTNNPLTDLINAGMNPRYSDKFECYDD